MALLTPKELSEKLKVTVKALGVLEKRDPTFPRAVRVSKRTLRWDEGEVDEWLEMKKGGAHEAE